MLCASASDIHAGASHPDTHTPARTDAEVEERLRLLPRYRVLLHNDDHNEMLYVVHALLSSVPSLTSDEAVQIMLEAHLAGTAPVVVCPKETAEHYCSSLTGFGLTSTIEPE